MILVYFQTFGDWYFYGVFCKLAYLTIAILLIHFCKKIFCLDAYPNAPSILRRGLWVCVQADSLSKGSYMNCCRKIKKIAIYTEL